VDVSLILLLPVSAVVTFVTVLWADASGRLPPRLVWPFLLSTLGAWLFLGLPAPAGAITWVAMLFAVATWAAFGTVIGALFARIAGRLLGLRP
jgi:hypothetical protein